MVEYEDVHLGSRVNVTVDSFNRSVLFPSLREGKTDQTHPLNFCPNRKSRGQSSLIKLEAPRGRSPSPCCLERIHNCRRNSGLITSVCVLYERNCRMFTEAQQAQWIIHKSHNNWRLMNNIRDFIILIRFAIQISTLRRNVRNKQRYKKRMKYLFVEWRFLAFRADLLMITQKSRGEMLWTNKHIKNDWSFCLWGGVV